ncbi:putative nucleic acid-binding Zn ribbon protein [Clostridium saccharobutylicum]|nr:putative nucleic acid-binding Zn ribbon protein [Clostridium saccharobutylicum]
MSINNPTVLYFENIQSITEKQFDTFFNYLPNYRKEKILKYKFQKDKNTSLIAFLLLLYGLNITCPENIPNMCYNFGKPFLKTFLIFILIFLIVIMKLHVLFLNIHVV